MHERSFSASPRAAIPGAATEISFLNAGSGLPGGFELLATAQASHHDLAAPDVSRGPLPAPLSSLHLSGMAERTHYGWALLGDRANHRLRILGLRILWLCCGRWRGWILQRLPASAAKAGREVYRCSTVTAVDNRRLIHVVLLSAEPLTGLKIPLKFLSAHLMIDRLIAIAIPQGLKPARFLRCFRHPSTSLRAG